LFRKLSLNKNFYFKYLILMFIQYNTNKFKNFIQLIFLLNFSNNVIFNKSLYLKLPRK